MDKPRIILGIESSCDETAASVVRKSEQGVIMLSNIVATSLSLQSKYGGIIPEQAAREQLKSIIPVIEEALRQARCEPPDIDAVAVTQGPGLIGSLLVGVETAKTLSILWDKPLIPVNHLIGHFYANWVVKTEEVILDSKSEGERVSLSNDKQLITNQLPAFPAIGLLVSGGHTDLVLMKNHQEYEYLGGTRDDAAGEAFDKTARLIGLPYPGGPAISGLAKSGNPNKFKLPKPMIDSPDLDFSFSGLKTAVANLAETLRYKDGEINSTDKADLAAAIEKTVIEVLVAKTINALRLRNVEQLLVAGGVAANQLLNQTIRERVAQTLPHVGVLIPPPKLCTDNAAYIGAAAFYNFLPIPPLSIQANPSLSLRH